ncbi:MAG: CPBP family intramembrane glutamic endopeptidase [Micropepsaceae bacterium]
MQWLQKWAVAIGIIGALGLSTVSSRLLRPVLIDLGVTGYAFPIAVTMFDLIVLICVVLIFGGKPLATIAEWSGLNAPLPPALLFALAVFVPAIAVCAYLAPYAKDIDAAGFAWKVVGGPFCEELAFRGIALGALIQFCGWRFLPAALLPALIFGLAHASQGNDAMEAAGIVAITAAGGLFFGWLFVKWSFSIWVPFLFHAGMNGIWLVFDLGENAVGGWFGNIVRIAVVAAAIAITVWVLPAFRKPPVEPAISGA